MSRIALRKMSEAESYEDWLSAAMDFDKSKGHDRWKAKDETDLYDFKAIKNRLTQLREFSDTGDNAALLFSLNEGIHGNLGGMGRSGLYKVAKVGTKRLIEDYTDEVVAALEHLGSSKAKGISMHEKIDFFHRANLCYGHSALMFSGSGTHLFFHVGVLKALWEQGLVPDVISGASGGSIVAAVVGTRKREDWGEIFDVDFLSFDGKLNSILDRIKPGNKQPVVDTDLQEIVSSLIPDLTFAEAYDISGLKINVSIAPAETHQKSRLLNAVTTPNVLIREAVLASSCIPGFFHPVTLAARNVKGERVPYLSNRKWVDGSLSDDLPIKRLARLYGVNHSIVSQTNPLVLPFISAEGAGTGVLSTVTQTGLNTLKEWGLAAAHIMQKPLNPDSPVSKIIDGYMSLVSQTYTGDINILPSQRILNPTEVLSVKTPAEILDLMREGERSTWPHLERIRTQTKISQTLQHLVDELDMKVWKTALPSASIPARNKRSASKQTKLKVVNTPKARTPSKTQTPTAKTSKTTAKA